MDGKHDEIIAVMLLSILVILVLILISYIIRFGIGLMVVLSMS